jgi:acyl carrier protein
VECAVAGVFQAVPGNPQIAAYIVCKPGMAATSKELQEYVKQKLPDYMLPQFFVFLDALPLTPNGKVERKTLPAPNVHNAASHSVRESGTAELETVIAEVWQDVLGVEKVSLHQNLFDLGANSLSIAEACAELSRLFNRELKIVELFTYPTVNSLASYLGNRTNVPGHSANTASRAAARRQTMRNRGEEHGKTRR